jgi:hypothetical protein
MKQNVSTVLELTGAGLVVAGVAMVAPPLALILCGLIVVVSGYTLGGQR